MRVPALLSPKRAQRGGRHTVLFLGAPLRRHIQKSPPRLMGPRGPIFLIFSLINGVQKEKGVHRPAVNLSFSFRTPLIL